VSSRKVGGSTLPGRSAFVGTAPNLAEAPSASMASGRGSVLPQVEPVYERLPVFTPSADARNSQRGQPAAQTEQQLSSSAAHKPSQKPKQQARCQKCAVADNLRRVRCCSVHYCVSCLAQLISWSCEQQGAQLTCLACRSPWDLQKLAMACNLELPAAVLAGLRRSSAGVGGSISDSACQGHSPAKYDGMSSRGPPSTSYAAHTAATLPHRANPGHLQQQHQTLR